MSSSGSPNAQAEALLQALYKFILPLTRSTFGERTDAKNISFGIEAKELVMELEKFISAMILCSQPTRNQDIAIVAKLDDDYLEANPEDEATTMGASSIDKNLERIPTDRKMIQNQAVSRSLMSIAAKWRDPEWHLPVLRRHVIQTMPIRLLCFEPHDSELKISLLSQTEVYNYLASKFRASFDVRSAVTHHEVYASTWIEDHARYAILSHTWNQTPGELTYSDWKGGSLDATQPKCRKLINFCKAAWKNHGITLGWIDTICINKESSTELDESIRSMYAWYSKAFICIIYLARSEKIEDMHNDPWFTRGWTLQELVAPLRIKFYNTNWNPLSDRNHPRDFISGLLLDYNDKRDIGILEQIILATTITSRELQNFRRTPISRKMQLVARRQVTRGEDIAYCLMGIFDVSISTAYGEGADRAFFRLVEEIFRSTKDVSDVFNWAGNRALFTRQPITSLFPSHPGDYLNRSENEQLLPWIPLEPLTLTHLGLRIPILLMPALASHRLRGSEPSPIGDYYADVPVNVCAGAFEEPQPQYSNYRLLDMKVSGPGGVHEVRKIGKITLTFGTLNVEEQGFHIRVPKVCLAVLLKQQVGSSPLAYEKAPTEKPIVFDLEKTGNNSDIDDSKRHYEIKRSQLGNHGMQLVTLYL